MRPLGWPAVWAPDGEGDFYHKYHDTAKALAVVARDFATGQEKELYSVADPSYYCAGVALSRDGQQLVFAVHEAESQTKILRVLPAAGGKARDLLREVQMPSPGSIAWAPDGHSVLFVQPNLKDSKTEVWLIPVQGGEPRSWISEPTTSVNSAFIRTAVTSPSLPGTTGRRCGRYSDFLPAAEATVAR